MTLNSEKLITKSLLGGVLSVPLMLAAPALALASEANLVIPELSKGQNSLLLYGILVCVLGMLFGLYQFMKVKKLEAHQSM
ncbi:MAG: hypothetical protein ABFD08_14375, partial [Syntrophomonas sp.]